MLFPGFGFSAKRSRLSCRSDWYASNVSASQPDALRQNKYPPKRRWRHKRRGRHKLRERPKRRKRHKRTMKRGRHRASKARQTKPASNASSCFMCPRCSMHISSGSRHSLTSHAHNSTLSVSLLLFHTYLQLVHNSYPSIWGSHVVFENACNFLNFIENCY